MGIKKITAIIDELQVKGVQWALEQNCVSGVTIYPVKGRGDFFNMFSHDHLVDHVQIDIYTSEEHVENIVDLIMDTADVGGQSEGLVVVTSVESMYWIKGKKAAYSEEFKFKAAG